MSVDRSTKIAWGIVLGTIVVAWFITTRPATQPSVRLPDSAPRSQTKTVDNPVPQWLTEGSTVYVPAVVGFRIDRDDLDKWPLRLSDLTCGNTQFCVYGVDVCEPWRAESVGEDYARLTSRAGPHFEAVGPWELVFQSRQGCRTIAARHSGTWYITVNGMVDRQSMRRPK